MSTEPQNPLERFQKAVKNILTVSKDEMARRESEYKRQRAKARKARA